MMHQDSHFVSMAKAVPILSHDYEGDGTTDNKAATIAVDSKLAEGSIHLGQPPMQAGDTLLIIDDGCPLRNQPWRSECRAPPRNSCRLRYAAPMNWIATRTPRHPTNAGCARSGSSRLRKRYWPH